MDLFADRVEAGNLLAKRLAGYSGSGATVFGIPRGGVAVAARVAKALSLPLLAIVVRKLGAPGNPELAIGAVANDGIASWNEEIIRGMGIDDAYRKAVLASEFAQVKLRVALFGAKPVLDARGKTAILVDDGIATGATMVAALKCLRGAGARRVVVAVPVCPPGAGEAFSGLADEFACLESPASFGSVGQSYSDFAQVEDDEVRRLLARGKALGH